MQKNADFSHLLKKIFKFHVLGSVTPAGSIYYLVLLLYCNLLIYCIDMVKNYL